MATQDVPPPPRKEDQKFDHWLYQFWRRVGVTAAGLVASSPLTISTGAGTYTFGHGTSGVASGTYGSTTVIPQVVVNTWGHVTAINTLGVTVSGTGVTGTNVTFSAPIVGTLTNAVLRAGTIGHGTSGVTSGTYGDGANAVKLHVNEFGHVTAITTVPITGGTGTGSGVSPQDVSATAPIILSGTYVGAALQPFNIAHGTSGAIPGTYGGTFGLPQVVVDTYGHVSGGTSFPLQATVPITVGSNAGTYTWGHSTSGVVTGTYGGALGLPQVVVNTFGHVTAGTSLALAATTPITLGSNAGTWTWGHSTSGVVTGTYGGAGTYVQITVNTSGHVTAIAAPVSGKWSPWSYIVTTTDTLDIDDGEQMVFGQQLIVEGTGVVNVDGTGQLHIY